MNKFLFYNYDYFISKGIKFANYELASKFAQDPLTNLTKTFGFHGDKNFIRNIRLWRLFIDVQN